MSSVKPRCTITFEPDNYNALRQASLDTGESMSALINQIMAMMLPSLGHISAAKRMVEAGLRNTGEQAFMGFLSGLKGDFDESMSEAERAFLEAISAGEDAENMQADGSGRQDKTEH